MSLASQLHVTDVILHLRLLLIASGNEGIHPEENENQPRRRNEKRNPKNSKRKKKIAIIKSRKNIRKEK